MSGGNMRSHEKCKKSDKFDYDSEICKVCGYYVFFKNDGQNKLFENNHSQEVNALVSKQDEHKYLSLFPEN